MTMTGTRSLRMRKIHLACKQQPSQLNADGRRDGHCARVGEEEAESGSFPFPVGQLTARVSD
jgi:hypothetical protein